MLHQTLPDSCKIITGQNPHEPDMVPHLGSAFSQTNHSTATPSANVFSKYFEDRKAAMNFMRRIWTMLSVGVAFANADYHSASLGGGNSDVDCILRVNRVVKFLFYSVVSRPKQEPSIKVMCAGDMGVGRNHLSENVASLVMSSSKIGRLILEEKGYV